MFGNKSDKIEELAWDLSEMTKCRDSWQVQYEGVVKLLQDISDACDMISHEDIIEYIKAMRAKNAALEAKLLEKPAKAKKTKKI